MTTTDDETAERAVAELIDGFFEAMDARDLEAVGRLCARDADVVHVGTEADERWVGWEALVSATREQFAELRSFRVRTRERRVELLGSGDAACFSQAVDLETEGGDGATRIEGARLTGVAERREGGWVLVQTHLSVPDGGRDPADPPVSWSTSPGRTVAPWPPSARPGTRTPAG